jgi:pseudaminic acid synthase
MKISDREISVNQPPFIIAEMSGNHNKSLKQAIEIVKQASNVGVEAIKLQTYTADTLTLDVSNSDFIINDKKSLWDGMSMYDLYKKASTPWAWHKEIFQVARDLGLICFSTPFDETAVDFLEDLNVPAYKISSFENIHIPLIKKILTTGKPIIMSTGMASISELSESIEIINSKIKKNLCILKCTSTYPADPSDSNILTIPHMRDLFDCEVGLSDHTKGIGTSIAAVSHSASIIEKHFTLDKNDGGVDSVFSIDPSEMKVLVSESKQAWESLGKIKYGPTSNELKSIKRRRSIYVSQDISKFDKITKNNIKIIRPGYGLPPKYYGLTLGKKVNKSLLKGTPLSWDFID